MPVEERVLFPYLAAAWAATLSLVVTVLVGNALGERGLPFRVGGGVMALLAAPPVRLGRATQHLWSLAT